MLVTVITNQSGIGRGYYDWNAYLNVTRKMIELLGSQANPDIIMACGSKPNSDGKDSEYRKPNTGMIDYIRSRVHADCLSVEMLVGDKKSDIECGIRANIKTNFHVLTGHGNEERGAINSFSKSTNYSSVVKVRSIHDVVERLP